VAPRYRKDLAFRDGLTGCFVSSVLELLGLPRLDLAVGVVRMPPMAFLRGQKVWIVTYFCFNVRLCFVQYKFLIFQAQAV
jgi:hypothetical protein